MQEKNTYSVDEILRETKHRTNAPSSRDISRKAQQQADEILKQLRTMGNTEQEKDDFDAFLKTLSKRTSAAYAQEPERVKEIAKEPIEEKPQPKLMAVSPVVASNEVTVSPEPGNIPQSKKRLKSIDEVVRDIEPDESMNKIDKAVLLEKDEKEVKREKQLTRTGVIRKANGLIESEKTEPVEPAPLPEQAKRMGTLHTNEKIVGEKEDIQTAAYNAYIRTKEKKKQDTGMIKSIDIKIAEKDIAKTRTVAAKPQADGKTKIGKPLLADEPTTVEKTIIGSRRERIISNIYHTGNIEGQTRLEGFFDEEEVEKISEDELEKQLEVNRREKIGSFEMQKDFEEREQEAAAANKPGSIDQTYAPEKETPIINDIIDYNSKNDQRAVYLELEQLQNRFKLRTTITFALTVAIALIGIFASGILPDFGLGTGTERIYIIINTVLLLLLGAVNVRAVFKGIKSLVLLKPSADSLSAFACVLTLVHCILSFLFGENGAGVAHLYAGTVGFVLLVNCLSKRSLVRRIFKNFRFLIKKGEKHSAAGITEPKEVKEFLKGSEQKRSDIRYSVKTAFSTRFLANSFADDPADTLAKNTVYPVLGVAAVTAIITYFITKDLLSAFSALTVIVLAGIPVCSGLSFQKALENADSTLLKERGTITGFAATEDIAGTTAVVLESHELFPQKCCRLKGMKLFKKMQMDEAILYAASVLSTTKHPFSNVFMESVSDVTEHMPEALDTAYESKLGITSWVYERKVLLGTEKMMGAHGVDIPATAKPEEYNHDNARVMFLAIDGAIYAMFVLEYFAEEVIEYELQRLEESGIEIFVKTADANIDEQLLSEIFELDTSSVKILSTVASAMYEEKTEKAVYNEAKLITRGDPITFMRGITACSILNGQFKLLKMLHYVAIAVGVVITVIFALMSSIASIGPVHLVVYGAFWTIVTNVIPRIYKAVPKR